MEEWGLLGGVKTKYVMLTEDVVGGLFTVWVESIEDAESTLKRWEKCGGPQNQFAKAIVVDMGIGMTPALVATLRKP